MPRMKRCQVMLKPIAGMTALVVTLGGAAIAEGAGDNVRTVPSGYDLYLQELLFELRQDNSNVARFRYVMPIIGQEAITFVDVEQDFPHLCENDAIPTLSQHGETVDQVIISLADRELDFGATSSVATQFFEAFRVENGVCIWEGF